MSDAGGDAAPLDGQTFELVGSVPEPGLGGREALYALFAPAPGLELAYTQPQWAEAVRAQRAHLGGLLFFDRVLSLAIDSSQAAELYPPTSEASLHALLDLVDGQSTFSKAQTHALLFYLLYALFPSPPLSGPAFSSSSGKQVIRFLRAQQVSSPAHAFAKNQALPPPLQRTITAYALLDHGLYDRAVGYMRPDEVEFSGDILATFRSIPDTYAPPSAFATRLSSPRTYAPGEYRSRVLVALVDTLSLDLPQAWMDAVHEAKSHPDDTDVLKDAHANWVAHIAALSLTPGCGPWTAWQAVIEQIPDIRSVLEEEALLDEDEGWEEGRSARQQQLVTQAIDELQVDLARAIWESAFAPAVRPRAVEELLSMPISSTLIAPLKEAVLTPSSRLSEAARAASADTLLTRSVADARYVDALRLDAQLGGTEALMAVPAAQRAALAARRRDLIRGVRSILPPIQRKTVDLELFSAQPQGRKQELQMSWDHVPAMASADTHMEEAASASTPTDQTTAAPQPLSTLLRTANTNADPQISLLAAMKPTAAPTPQTSFTAPRSSSVMTGGGDTSSSFIPGYWSRAGVSAAAGNGGSGSGGKPTAETGSSEPAPTADMSTTSVGSRKPSLKPRISAREPFSDPANLSVASMRSQSRAGDRSHSTLILPGDRSGLSFLSQEPTSDSVAVKEEPDHSMAWGRGLPTHPLPSLSPPPPDSNSKGSSSVLGPASRPRISLAPEETSEGNEPAGSSPAPRAIPKRSEPKSKPPPEPRSRTSRAPRKVLPKSEDNEHESPDKETSTPDDAKTKKTTVTRPARRFAHPAKTRKAGAPTSTSTASYFAPVDTQKEDPIIHGKDDPSEMPKVFPGTFPGLEETEDADLSPSRNVPGTDTQEVEMREARNLWDAPPPRRTSPRRRRVRTADADDPHTLVDVPARPRSTRITKRPA